MKTKSLITASMAASCQLLVLLSLSWFALSATAAHEPKPEKIWEGKGDGRSAEAQFSDEGGGGRIHLFQNGDSTFLFYEIWGNDPTSRDCTFIIDQFGNVIEVCVFTRFNYDYGWGEIPNSDVQFLADGSMRLVTTTGANFSSTHCTTDTAGATPVTTCAPATAVSFDLTWEPNAFSTLSTKGETEHAFAEFEFESKGSSESCSAYVTGNANGHTMSNAPGRVGETKGKNTATVLAE